MEIITWLIVFISIMVMAYKCVDKLVDKKIRDNNDNVIEYVNGRFMLINKKDKL